MTANASTFGYCPGCGTQLAAAGAYCPGCGQPVARYEQPTETMQAVGGANGSAPLDGSPNGNGSGAPSAGGVVTAERVATAPRVAQPAPSRSSSAAPGSPVPPPAPEGGSRGRARWWWVAAIVAVLAVAGGVTAGVLLSRGGSSASQRSAASAQERLRAAFAPVVVGNRSLSSALVDLHGAHPRVALQAARQTQAADDSARGALGALALGPDQQALAGPAREALDREASYLSAVSATLSDPTNPAVSQLPTLASNLTSAVDAVPGGVAGSAADVSGTDALVAWAHKTAKAQASGAPGSSTGSPSSSGAAGGAPASGATAYTDCDANIQALSGTTSCAFAQNVFYQYYVSGQSSSLSVYSPATGQRYDTMCIAGDTVVCTTPQGAEVQFSQAAINAYTSDDAARYAASHDVG